MDKSTFVAPAGELVQIDRPAHPQRKDWAFVPSVLPPVWEFDQSLWPLVAEARERLGTLNGIGQNLDDPDLLLHPLQNREAISSSQIEGTFVTAEQLLLFEIDRKDSQSRDDKRADGQEVYNDNQALKTGCTMIENWPLGNHVIRSMHSVLMTGVRGRDRSPGKFRQKQVQIGSTARYIPPPSAEVPRLMQNLEKFIADDEPHGLDPLVKCFVVHYQFEAIHPFEDGNGRVGRALLALMIYKLFQHKRPWLYLSAFFDRFQDEYFSNLFQVSASAAWGPWIEFCLNATIAQANDAIRRCNQFRELKASFHERMTSPSARSHQQIDMLFRTPLVRISNLSKEFGVHYQTAQSDVQRLVNVGILSELSGHRPKTYFAREIMDIAYGSDASF